MRLLCLMLTSLELSSFPLKDVQWAWSGFGLPASRGPSYLAGLLKVGKRPRLSQLDVLPAIFSLERAV